MTCEGSALQTGMPISQRVLPHASHWHEMRKIMKNTVSILTDGCAGHFGALCSPLCQETLELHYVSAELYSKHTEDEDQDVFQS